ncbi:LysR substrate-binding domain-containing protein [Acinetobacter shaoyimingii]|uniref:LysR family transcriptional regulator n=1 Tax=Acinetobacter shaoyimingii TaxID=2715164 RepID=A0A6G8RU06_9GAMM|nr:LysR substrate-binding domain-containing protein [Acinetobacter shaoyimingii]QIO05416.1 LysR family transcriptional regulator [Acinetobacter shaoyimingii]
MELRHLKYFISVAEELNFTRAAEKIFIAQPSLSQQIKDLEEELGAQLFLRKKRSLSLTEEGQQFYIDAKHILELAAKAKQNVQLITNCKKNKLNIGFLPIAEMKIFPYVMPLIRAEQSDLDIQFYSLSCLAQIQALKDHQIDVAFTRQCINDDQIASIELFSEPLVLLIPSASPFAKHDIISKEDLIQQKFILSEEMASPVLFQKTQEIFKSLGTEMQISQHSSNILMNVNLVGMQIGWTIVPAYVESFLGPNVLIKRTQVNLPNIGLYLNYRKNDESESLKLVKSILSQHFHCHIF